MKVKILLMALLIAFSSYPVTYASVLFNSAVDSNEFPGSHYPVNDADIFLDTYQEKIVPFEEALDVATIVVYPPLEKVSEPETYVVVQGDNLWRIANAHNVSLESLKGWNGLAGDLIYPEDVLIVEGNEIDIKTVDPVPIKTIAVAKKKQTQTQTQTPSSSPSPPPATSGKEILVTATAYTAYCKGCSGTTAYGIDLRANPNLKVVAVDPKVIPLGTRVWVEGYGEAIAGDTGGAIKGNKIDVFIASHDSAMQWGVKTVKIKVLH